uniref:ABC transporter domain-containing protein n=1 Tax=Kalanchoe fedtschenkoi TaxID=63787 RepID=A0A7N0VBS3_KALFE
MFRELESHMGNSFPSSNSENDNLRCGHGIESYGVSVTTLEEVFLRVAGCSEEAEPVVPKSFFPNNDVIPKRVSCDKLWANYKRITGVTACIIARGFSMIVAAILGFWTFVSLQCCSCCFMSRSTFWVHFKALYTKRLIMARRDRKTVVFQLLIPAVFLLFGLLLLTLKPHPDQKSVTFTTSHFNPLLGGGGGGGPIPFDLSSQISNEVADYVKGGWIQRYKPTAYKFPDTEKALADANTSAGPSLGPLLLSMSEYLMSSLNESYESRYGAVVMDDQTPDGSIGYTVLHNSSCQHAAPTFINVVNSAILRLATSDKNMTIQARNHPLPMTKTQHMQRHDLDAFSAAVIVNIAFSFIPASFAVAIVKEREVKAKHQQLISGVSIYSYWISTYTWDFISFLFPSSIAMLLFYIFGLEQFIGKGRFFPTALMFLEYGLAIASSTYCLSFFFSDHTLAQNVVLLVHFFSGLILMVISFIMGIMNSTSSVNSFLKHFFRLSPGFCFADGLASLALLRQGMKDGSDNSVLDWNVTGASLSYLGVESIAYFVLALVFELFQPSKFTPSLLKEWLMDRTNAWRGNPCGLLEPLAASEVVPFEHEDIDVQMERNRVLTGSTSDALICLRNLRKVYPGEKNLGKKVAVHSLTFSVKEGECFGFLGTNGAGKTTTLSMLCGEELPTDGTATIFGKDIRSHPKAARQHIGYCPQFDALLDCLTVKEHLQLYARIKGVPENRLEIVVMEKIVEFDLLKHVDKPAFCLSGGNKRKLSVAVAMIGDPPIVILDEPSTGMDPVAKRFMWEVISHLSTRRGKTAVILTTHSMNEAQALCTRIGIMVGGKLRCLGSPQHLKTRYGNHLELEIKPTEITSSELESLCHIVQEKLLGVSYQRKGILGDLETCIGVSDSITSEHSSVAEINMTLEMISIIGSWLGNEDRVDTLIHSRSTPDGTFDSQLSEQLIRDGGIPLPVFSEWWLLKEKFSVIDSFINSSFSRATVQSFNGLSIKYQLQYEEGLSLADVFGCLERNRYQLGIAEYSISQSTLETIFNHFAAKA